MAGFKIARAFLPPLHPHDPLLGYIELDFMVTGIVLVWANDLELIDPSAVAQREMQLFLLAGVCL